ncbi:hypothetical protein A3A21_02465 [Candidatus Jorgensenbacteria bacterium RIFCSPLOWO2_01_FULL_45_25b]|uniref:Uncharacterized protein n=1 Tax=Candidatus Jorgensenbacteria bacterium RIFCSPLOWO2_01_FULL_45_25b TaxID=1798471 RepID=A0A1F6BTE5_9BACT|nr:MAG: hypothetical protein A3A21_02465 [Candidatus Jorgensenbacteria bacterium RIFCSPLOWO2_01_FULL_45_25b]
MGEVCQKAKGTLLKKIQKRKNVSEEFPSRSQRVLKAKKRSKFAHRSVPGIVGKSIAYYLFLVNI